MNPLLQLLLIAGVVVTTTAVQKNVIQRESPIIEKSKDEAALLDSLFVVTKKIC